MNKRAIASVRFVTSVRSCVWGSERTYIISDPHVRDVEFVLTVPLRLSNFKLLPLHFFKPCLLCILPYHLLTNRMRAVFDWETGWMPFDHCVQIPSCGRVSRFCMIHWLVSYPLSMQVMPEMHSRNSPLQIYCDLDDVLTDFEESASQAIGVSLNRVSVTTLWDCLKKKFSFFETLPWKKGTCGRERKRVCV